MIEVLNVLCSLLTCMKLTDASLTHRIVVIERGIAYEKEPEGRLRVQMKMFYKERKRSITKRFIYGFVKATAVK